MNSVTRRWQGALVSQSLINIWHSRFQKVNKETQEPSNEDLNLLSVTFLKVTCGQSSRGWHSILSWAGPARMEEVTCLPFPVHPPPPPSTSFRTTWLTKGSSSRILFCCYYWFLNVTQGLKGMEAVGQTPSLQTGIGICSTTEFSLQAGKQWEGL